MITIDAGMMGQITRAAQEAYPNECCGLLAGYGDLDSDITITRVRPSENVSEEGVRDRFEVDPKVRFDLMRELADGAERIVGHYHSHPGHPAMPSEHDLKMAFEPDLLWLIVGLDQSRITEVKAHQIDTGGSGFCEIAICVN